MGSVVLLGFYGARVRAEAKTWCHAMAFMGLQRSHNTLESWWLTQEVAMFFRQKKSGNRVYLQIDKTFLIAQPMRKVYWTKWLRRGRGSEGG